MGERGYRQYFRRFVQDEHHLFDTQRADTGYSLGDLEGEDCRRGNWGKFQEAHYDEVAREVGDMACVSDVMKGIHLSLDVVTKLFRFSSYVLTRKLRREVGVRQWWRKSCT
ncbi:hypothetical protein KFK09_025489 [Dendrobium nobile]|uniref:Uncharacterized protein n=1 Tax=Dendrobium nobile TaxID=94219 RepID=A0A8T3AGI6_DENNO|nr:hypothetical protein KFK09_025489 [Dendrobium nobile]